MNRYYRLVVISFLFVVIFVIITFFLNFKQNFPFNSIEFAFSRMLTLFYFNFFFFSLFFLVDTKFYGYIFVFFVVFGTSVWIFEYTLQFVNLEIPTFVFDLNDLILFATFNVVTPGLNLLTVYYIKKIGSKYAGANLFRKYHVHEGFFGVLLLILALVLYLLRSIMVQVRIFWRELRLLLAIEVIFLFLFLYFGSFFVFRDWRDVIRFKFIEKIKSPVNSDAINNRTRTFSQITLNDLHFFKTPKPMLYPFGMWVTSFGFSMICFGTYFIPKEIFHLEYELVVQLGFLFSFLAAGSIGIDWIRIFRRFYPELYREVETAINKIHEKKTQNDVNRFS